jgi:N-carbamoyl-L-amino-acid hydrolase
MSRPVLDVAALHRMLDEQAAIGATPEGGLHRVSASAEDGRVRDWLTAWFRAHGLRPLVDPVGNQFGLLELAGPDAPLLLTGSHLDSQPQGGRFDGAYGVVASCQAVAAIHAAVAAGAPRPRCNLGVVNWTNEEGARFQPSLLGSSVYAGTVSAAAACAQTDRDGVRLDEALDAIGYRRGDSAPRASAYVELHVECGPELEGAQRRIGVVESWWGTVKTTVEMVGRQAHTGPTAMRDRRDALYAAALLVVAVRRLADEANSAGDEALYTSVGRAEVSPNSPNVVAGRVMLWVELRSPHADVLERAQARLASEVERAAAAAGVLGRVAAESVRPAGRFDRRLAELVDAVARRRGHEPLRLATVAAHDAISLARLAPSMVVNVPSARGVCHHPDEYTAPEDLEEGAQVLLEVLWDLCRAGGESHSRKDGGGGSAAAGV